MAFQMIPVDYLAPGRIGVGDTVDFKWLNGQELRGVVFGVDGSTVYAGHEDSVLILDRSDIHCISRPVMAYDNK